MISELPRARPLWRTDGSGHQKSCCCERHQLGRAVSSGTLRNIVLKQRQGPCLQTISLMKKAPVPSPHHVPLFTSAQCRQKVPDPESALVKSVADREGTESLHWLPAADSWASQDLNPGLWRQALRTLISVCLPDGPDASQCLRTISKRSTCCHCQYWGLDFSSPNSAWSESFPGLQRRKQFPRAHRSY